MRAKLAGEQEAQDQTLHMITFKIRFQRVVTAASWECAVTGPAYQETGCVIRV